MGLSQRSLLRWHDDKAAGRSKLTPNLKMFGGVTEEIKECQAGADPRPALQH